MDDMHREEHVNISGTESHSEDEDSKCAPFLEEGRQCNPPFPVEMLNDADRMRGDAIGNTLYSECWVLKILMKLTKLTPEEWSEDMETELCLLWDMTIEPDVVEKLVEYNFIDMSSQIIRDSTIPRLTEILVGIIGNMSCIPSVRADIAQDSAIIGTLLGLLTLPDVPILLQLIRLLQACFWDLRNHEEKASELLEDVTESKMITSDSALDSQCSVTNFNDISAGMNENSEEDSMKLQSEEKYAMDLLCSESNNSSLNVHNESEVATDVLNLAEDNCDTDLSNRRTKNEASNIRDEVNKQKNAAGIKWLLELRNMNKWFPNLIFILKSCRNEELLRGTLSLLETLCYIPIDNNFRVEYFARSEIVEALVETLDQLKEECKKDGDMCLKTKFDKAICHWASILSAFTLYPEGRVVLGRHAEILSESICSQLVVGDDLLLHFDENQAEFIMLATIIVNSLLKDSGYFHPPIFNCFLSVLTSLREKNGAKSKEEDSTTDFASQEVQQELINNLEKYFEDVVQYADAEALSRVLQHCNKKHVGILQSVMEGQNSVPTS